MTGRKFLGAMNALISFRACASLWPAYPAGDGAQLVEERTGEQIHWPAGPYADPFVEEAIQHLLSEPLTASSAMQIALLNNKNLQAQYADLGIAQADLVQAGLPPNPIVDGTITFTDTGGTNLVFGGALKVIEILYIPLKKRVAESKLEEAKLQVASRVLDALGQTYLAFIEYQASRQTIEFLNQVLGSTRDSVAVAKGLREAGNITALEFETQNAELARQKLALGQAEILAVQARENLNVRMGLSGPQTQWHSAGRLPDVPASEIGTGNAEARAIEASLELSAAEQGLFTLAKKYKLTKAQSIIPELDAGGEWERDDGEEEAGPTFLAALPVFDWGKARKAKARMEIVKARDEFTALAVKVRSAARATRAELLTARKTALHYKSSVLPLSQRVLSETQRQYNAMQLGVFRLIRAKRDQIQAGQGYVGALAAYWIAKARFVQLMKGTLPAEGGRGGNIAADVYSNIVTGGE